jgi:SPP1 family phage portal protein
MFYLNRDTELTADLLQKIINKFKLNDLPKLEKWQNYYEGKHAILNKSYADENKECNRIVTNFCKVIADTYSGYICGKAVSYVSNDDITDIQEVLNYNDVAAADIAFINNMLVYGVAYELKWLDKFAQTRFTQINPLNCFAIYDNTLDGELLYFVRWYDADNFDETDLKYLEVRSATTTKTYKMNGLGGSLEFVSEEVHYFKDVPVSIGYLNDNEENIFNDIISLNDAYNELQSAEIDDFKEWVDSYLKLLNVDADEEDIANMKANRVLILPDGGNAEWLTKNANDTQIVNMLDNIKKNIFKITACPDMADETFLAQSGTALAYKLVGFENVASGIVARFKKALQRRIELICNILNLKATDAVWRDVQINFVRNLPVNITEIITMVNGLRGLVSDATLLAQVPFVTDVTAELEALAEQEQRKMSLYSFDTHTHTDTVEDTEETEETEEAEA